MSECVVLMAIPNSCAECRDMGLFTRCRFYTGNILRRSDRCPIICVLPEGHGRLVDEKEVKDWVENWLCVNKHYHPYSSSKSIPVSEIYDVLQRMDAAVPAERSET